MKLLTVWSESVFDDQTGFSLLTVRNCNVH